MLPWHYIMMSFNDNPPHLKWILFFNYRYKVIQGVAKRIFQNHHALRQQQKILQYFNLDTCFVHIFKSYFLFYKCSMWSPPAARTTSNQYENSNQTRLSMSRSTVLIAVVIQSFMLSILAGSGETYTLPLTYPHKKKSHTVRSGVLANQAQRVEHQRDSFKVNVFCAMYQEVYGPLFRWRKHYYRTNQFRNAPKLAVRSAAGRFEWLHFLANETSSPWHFRVRAYLNKNVSQQWIGKGGANDLALCAWSDRAPTSQCVTFSCRGLLKTKFMFHRFQLISITWKTK